MSFRLQREANYYRQVALDYETKKARDVSINLTHFTAPLLLLILATLISAVFGFVVPLLVLADVADVFKSPALVAAGDLAALILLAGYFVGELHHYRIFRVSLKNDNKVI